MTGYDGSCQCSDPACVRAQEARENTLREVRDVLQEDIEAGKKLWPKDECAQRSNACSRMLLRFKEGGKFEVIDD